MPWSTIPRCSAKLQHDRCAAAHGELEDVLQVVVQGLEDELLVVVAQAEQGSLVRIGRVLKAERDANQPRRQTDQDPNR